MNKEKPSFYAVLPASVRYDNNLSSSEKLFYAEITAMSEKNGYCWASNKYFAELYNCNTSTISGWANSLKNKGHIVIEYEKKGKQVIKRKMYPIQKIQIPYSENPKGGIQKIQRGYSENPKENTTRDNITSKNTTSNNNQFNEIEVGEVSIYEFEQFWSDYNKKVGIAKCEPKYRKIPEREREQIKEFLKIYIHATPNIQYRLNPETFINRKAWQDDWQYWINKAKHEHNNKANGKRQSNTINTESIDQFINEVFEHEKDLQDD